MHVEEAHEGKKKKPHKCTICDGSFKNKDYLGMHIESVHEGIKAHKCSICDACFGRKWTLEQHIRNIHDGIKPHK